MPTKTPFHHEDDKGIQHSVRFTDYNKQAKVTFQAPYHCVIQSFMILSEQPITLEMHVIDNETKPSDKLRRSHIRAKAFVSPESTKVYQHLFKGQVIRPTQNVNFVLTKEKGYKGKFNADLSVNFVKLKPMEDKDDFKKG